MCKLYTQLLYAVVKPVVAVRSVFMHLLTFLFQVTADYTVDEQLCFIVCDRYCFCYCGLYHFCTAVLLSTLALYQVQQCPKLQYQRCGLQFEVISELSGPCGVYNTLPDILMLNIYDVSNLHCHTFLLLAMHVSCIINRSESVQKLIHNH